MQKFEPELTERIMIRFVKNLLIAAIVTVSIGGSIIIALMLNYGFIEI